MSLYGVTMRTMMMAVAGVALAAGVARPVCAQGGSAAAAVERATSPAEAAYAAPDPVGAYVREALVANPGLRQQRLVLEGREAAVRQARGLFLPSVTLDTRYSDMQGGLDLGDLVNPAYRALNEITGSNDFPTNIDGRFPFAAETRVRLVQPVFNAGIVSNYQVNARLKDMQDARVRAGARQLAADVQLAYADHARAARVVAVYRATLELVNENVRVSRRLLENGKVTADAVHRADAERLAVEQQLADAEQKRDASAGRFNLLLGRELDAAVELVPDSALLAPFTLTEDEVVARALRAREELEQMEAGVRVAEAQRRAARATYLPNVSIAVDYGVQGNEYRFDRNNDFATLSVVASWNLFNGLQDAARAEQAELEAERARVQRGDVERQIELHARTAYEAVQVGEKSLAAANARAVAARRSYELVARRYEEGMASTLELLDARNALTNAELNRVLTVHDCFARRVELERAAALRDMDNDFGLGR